MIGLNLLRKMGIFAGVRQWEIEEADDENSVRAQINHSNAIRQCEEAYTAGLETSQHLRKTIERARSSAFADIESSIGGQRGQHP